LRGLNYRKYSEEQLVNLADFRRRQQLATTTATQLKFFNSSKRLVRVLRSETNRQATAATLIQSQWRVHKVTSKQLAAEIASRIRRKYAAAVCIQRHYRGYL
jgi:glycine/serine hydroxymethyltransferase